METSLIIQPTKIRQKVTFLICLLFGLTFINAGLNKLFNYMLVPDHLPEKMMKMGAALMEIGWLFPLVAIVEILRGILLTHLTAAPAGLPMAFILLAIHLWIIIDNRAKYLRMIN